MKGRVYLLLVLTLLGFGAVLARLFEIQVIDHEKFSDMAIRQASRANRVERQRGTIYDRRGRELAISVRVKSLAVNPKKFATPEARGELADKLEPILGLSRGTLLARLDRSGEFAWIARKIPESSAAEIAALKIPGLFFQTEFKRHYPHDSAAAHILGFVGIDDAGLEGIEKSQDGILRGPDPEGSFITDAYGNPIPVGGEIRYPQFNGRSIHLTIDLAIQSSLEQAILRQVEAFGAKSASGIVIDPATGAILALANYPTFNPNDLVASDASMRRNRAISDAFEPGSTFKIFTGAMGLEKGVVRENETFHCVGALTVHRHSIRCHHAHGTVDYRRALEVSCNVAAMLVSQRLDPAALYQGLLNFGFGKKTGIDLPGEAGGILRPPEKWSGLSTSMLALGQEISVTALQLATATAAMANGGRMMTPRLISRITDANNKAVKVISPSVEAHPIEARVAHLMSRILEGVVSRGTGTLAEVRPFPVSGKTGTAQISGPSGGYIGGRYNAVFIGWTPSEAPVLAMAIVVHDPDPSKGYYGGQVAAPIFGWVGTEAMQYLGIRPALGRDTASVAARPPRPAITARVSGNRVEVPNVAGLTIREVHDVFNSLPLRFSPSGSGVAVSQSPAPGTLVPLDSRVTVSFTPPAGVAALAEGIPD